MPTHSGMRTFKTKDGKTVSFKAGEKAKFKPKAKETPTISDATAFRMKKEIAEDIADSFNSMEADLPEKYKKLRDRFRANVPYRTKSRFDDATKGTRQFDKLKLGLAKAIKPSAKSTTKSMRVLLNEAKKKGVLKGEILNEWNKWKNTIAKAHKEIEPFF